MSSETLGVAPPHDAPLEELRGYLSEGYGLPDGYVVHRVVRYGGRAGTGLAVFIHPPGGGGELRIHYEREADCSNPNKLRSRATADTRGLTRGNLINSPKAAHAMFEALCALAENFEAADQEGQTWEWVQQLQRIAARTRGQVESYQSLKRLQDHDYSKRLVQDPPKVRHHGELVELKATPLLLDDESDGHVYITARQMAVFLRYDLGVEDAGSDDQILTRLQQVGGERVPVQVWDKPGRDRAEKVRLVLYRLPQDDPSAEDDEK